MGKIKQQKGGFCVNPCLPKTLDTFNKANLELLTTSADKSQTVAPIQKAEEAAKVAAISCLSAKPISHDKVACISSATCETKCESIEKITYEQAKPLIDTLQNEIYLLNYLLDELAYAYNEKSQNVAEQNVAKQNVAEQNVAAKNVSYILDDKNIDKLEIDNIIKNVNIQNIKYITNSISQRIDKNVLALIRLSRQIIYNTKDSQDSREVLYPNKYKHRNYVNNNRAKYINILANSPLLQKSNKKYKLLKDAYENVIDYYKDIDKDKIQFLDPPSFDMTDKQVEDTDKQLEELEEKLRSGHQYKLETDLDFQYENESETKIFKKVKGGFGSDNPNPNKPEITGESRIKKKLAELNDKYKQNLTL